MRLQYSLLEQAIYQKPTIAELLQQDCPALGRYCISDYVGSPSMKDDPTTDNTRAAGFFDDKAHKETLEFVGTGESNNRDFNIAIFATFLAVEINPGTEHAEFLVLIPRRSPEQENAMYAGLMKSQNTDHLRQQLAENEDLGEQLASEVDWLITYLRSPPAQATAETSSSDSWFSRLFSTRKH